MKNNKYLEPSCLTLVEEFHDAFGHPVQDSPTIPSTDRAKLRIDLLEEELHELKVAIREQNMTGIADALTDLQYVLSGAILEFGLAEAFKPLFNEVHRSNMSKACSTDEEVRATMNFYRINRGVNDFKIVNKAGKKIVRAANDKVLKNIKYSPADLSGVLKLYIKE